jgi:tetratricopeptide (TPR) repeat protein
VADTYLAELLDPPALVAVKIVHAELAADRGQVEWLLREARAAAAVVDDNVAQVLDADISPEGEVYIVGEYVEGEDLACSCGAPVACRGRGSASWRCRSSPACARPTRPGCCTARSSRRTCSCRPTTRVKLVDFGLVRVENVTADREPGTVVLGDAVHFIAPEQALGEQVDARTDIYSVGVLLYTLLTGRVPFFGRPTQVAMQHKFATAATPGSVAPEAGIPAVVEALILKAMSKRRESRFADMAALEQALREVGDDGQRAASAGAPPGDGARPADHRQRDVLLARVAADDARRRPRTRARSSASTTRWAARWSPSRAARAAPEAEAWRGWIAQGREYAYYQLAERHLAAAQWSELVAVYREHADATADRNQKIGLLNAMGYVYDKSLADTQQAIAAYREMIALEPNAPDAVLALARLYERSQRVGGRGRGPRPLPVAVQRPGAARRGADPRRPDPAPAPRGLRAGRGLLHSALELQPGHAPALVLLADIYRGRKDYPRLAATLEAMAVGGASYYERIEFGAEAGFSTTGRPASSTRRPGCSRG